MDKNIKMPRVIEIPEKVKNQAQYVRSLELFKQTFEKMMVAYSQLPFHCGREVIPFKPTEISLETFNAHYEKMTAALSEELKAPWVKMQTQVMTFCKWRDMLLKEFPNAKFDIDESPSIQAEKRVKCNNVDEVCCERAMVDVTEDAKEYFGLMMTVNEALGNLHQYEREHGFKFSDMGKVYEYFMNPVTFFEDYNNNRFVKK